MKPQGKHSGKQHPVPIEFEKICKHFESIERRTSKKAYEEKPEEARLYERYKDECGNPRPSMRFLLDPHYARTQLKEFRSEKDMYDMEIIYRMYSGKIKNPDGGIAQWAEKFWLVEKPIALQERDAGRPVLKQAVGPKGESACSTRARQDFRNPESNLRQCFNEACAEFKQNVQKWNKDRLKGPLKEFEDMQQDKYKLLDKLGLPRFHHLYSSEQLEAIRRYMILVGMTAGYLGYTRGTNQQFDSTLQQMSQNKQEMNANLMANIEMSENAGGLPIQKIEGMHEALYTAYVEIFKNDLTKPMDPEESKDSEFLARHSDNEIDNRTPMVAFEPEDMQSWGQYKIADYEIDENGLPVEHPSSKWALTDKWTKAMREKWDNEQASVEVRNKMRLTPKPPKGQTLGISDVRLQSRGEVYAGRTELRPRVSKGTGPIKPREELKDPHYNQAPVDDEKNAMQKDESTSVEFA